MTSKEKTKYRTSKKWKSFRSELLKEYNYTCALCGTTKRGKQARGLQVHHMNEKSYGNETRNDVTLLCSGCHKLVEKMIVKYQAKNYKPTLWSEYMKPMVQSFTIIDLGEHSENFKPKPR